MYALTGKDLAVSDLPADTDVFSASDMLETVVLETSSSRPPDTVFEVADLELNWQNAAYRTGLDGSRVPGVLRGIRSLVDLRAAGRTFRVRGLLEVEFDSVGFDGVPRPGLDAGDLGRLLTLASGEPCGVLVAGVGTSGYAVPFREALGGMGLTLMETPPTPTLLELGYEAMAAEVQRSVSFDFGPRPMAEAA